MSTELRLEKRKMKAALLGEESAVPDLLGESILQNSLQFALGESDEIYGGYGRVRNAYPYRQRNGYKRTLGELEVVTAVLENTFLRAVFLPEYGGRLWELWDKEHDRNLLYTNDVLRFGNLAVRNAWFSGGVEWNVGIIGHTPFTTEQLYTARTVDDKENPVLRMYEYERIRNVTYQMDFWLEEDSCFLNCRMRIVNENDEVVPMYWWSNIAVPESEGGRIIVPAHCAYTNKNGIVYKTDIPMVNGIDITDYKKIPGSVDYFFELDPGAPKYIAHVNRDGFGMIQRSTDRLRSRKLFSWGKCRGSDHWQEFLTENAGRYLEIQAGIPKTQYGCIPMAPHTAWEWLEQYGPVQLDPSDLLLSHEERSCKMTKLLLDNHCTEQMEKKRKDSGAMAVRKADLLLKGSGYGVLGVHGPLTSHLEFTDESGAYRSWKNFLEGAPLPCPEPERRPDVFLADEESLARLKRSVKLEEKMNWYAHYQLGIRYFVIGRYKKSKEELKSSYALRKNAWACHGLACLNLVRGRKKKAVKWMVRGINLQNSEISYLKEGFRILVLAGGYESLCRFYENAEESLQNDSSLRFYYIKALSRTGEEKKAYECMERDGGLVLDAVREGEDSLAQLWSDLYEKIYGVRKEIPYRYEFGAVEQAEQDKTERIQVERT
ncbi:MAG: DUF5107 domain-containing protein [Candidatus Choladocola sp.]|nr:DUF5107 domain-containing protein [Candidatus Choladocola sp.]